MAMSSILNADDIKKALDAFAGKAIVWDESQGPEEVWWLILVESNLYDLSRFGWIFGGYELWISWAVYRHYFRLSVNELKR